MSVISFVSAIALLKRKNWARIIFIVLLSAGIIFNVVGLILQFTMLSSINEFTGGHTLPPEFQNMVNVMKIALAIMVIAISALFGFLIKKLCSPSIKAEFA